MDRAAPVGLQEGAGNPRAPPRGRVARADRGVGAIAAATATASIAETATCWWQQAEQPAAQAIAPARSTSARAASHACSKASQAAW
ncbi:MAG: hypothetical protein ACO3CC_10135 [Alphaproteobacteria bacterium]